MSILSKQVSYFPSTSLTSKGTEVNLLSILQSDEHKDWILKLRASEGARQQIMKEMLPCYTISGTFSHRSNTGLLKPSGLAGVDLDGAEGLDIQYLLKELQRIKSIAYAGLSCRGKRLFCIIPFQYPDKYRQQYERLIQSFTDMGLPMGDSCHKAISQPRFVSWNDETTQFFNHKAKPFNLLPAPKIYYPKKKTRGKVFSSSLLNRFQWCNDQINKKHEFAIHNRHQYILQLARYCNIKGLSQEETLYGCLNYIQPDFDETEITSIVKHIYTTQINSYNKIPLR